VDEGGRDTWLTASMGSGRGDRNQGGDIVVAWDDTAASMGSGRGDRNQQYLQVATEPAAVASMGSGRGDRNQLRGDSGETVADRPASMGSGRGDRNQCGRPGPALLALGARASMGSGRGDRNQQAVSIT